MAAREVTYEAMTKRPDDIWLLQYKPLSWTDRIICKATMAIHCHSAVAFKHNGAFVHVDTHPKTGATVQPLCQVIEKYSGTVDVFKIDYWCRSSIKPELFKSTILSFMGQSYGWRSIWRIVAGNTPWVWNAIPISTKDKQSKNILPTCSQLVAFSLREAGLDAVPRCPDWQVVPGDLTRSLAFRYDGVLTSSEMSRALCYTECRHK